MPKAKTKTRGAYERRLVKTDRISQQAASVASNLRRILAEKKWTPVFLAVKANVSLWTTDKLVRGYPATLAREGCLRRIAEALGVELWELL